MILAGIVHAQSSRLDRAYLLERAAKGRSVGQRDGSVTIPLRVGLLHFDEFEDDVGMFLSDLQQALRCS